ncbi:MAG: alanine--tRNA ligase [Candidatus Wildermuthbacteria bacterium]|nr:alanine--tRNA ligase [Candidatus Wildermuthbacteria bacterium]
MKSGEIRAKYLEFFEKKGHTVIPSSALVPENDPTTLFTGSGMQPLIPYLLGQKHPSGKRLTNSQKCFRAEDIEEVGDNRHTTFFEMLGNWSLGDYFKAEQLLWFFEFLTSVVGLDPNRLYVTVFSGDSANNIPKDEESIGIWKQLFAQKGIEAKDVELGSEQRGYDLGMQGGRIFAYDVKKNWWSRAGAPENMPAGEPGGPDSEVFYDFGTPHNETFGKYCHPNCDCGRFLEIGNSVFMEYQKQDDGSFAKLAQRNVDFGGGLERIVAASNDNSDIFTIDTLSAVIKKIEELSGASYEGNQTAFRVIADHIRGAVFMIGDGVLPSNTDRGYFVRRLLRRAVRYADVLNMKQGKFAELALPVIESYADHYSELHEYEALIKETIQKEESRFRETLANGLREFEKLSQEDISARDAFNLYQSYGFPLEVTVDLSKEKGIEVDEKGFAEEFKKHQEISRAGAEKKFKGGLADTKEETVRLHTAHHLLLAALRQVLGIHVHQRGSNITSERLRIDFSHPQKMATEELKQVEDLVNQKIAENLDMIRKEMPKEEAMKLGAEMEFGVKYGDMVSVYMAQDQQGNVFSKEFCGGPHAEGTGELGHFKILKEEAVSAGIRRIRAVLE